MYAIHYNQLEALKCLLDKNADVNISADGKSIIIFLLLTTGNQVHHKTHVCMHPLAHVYTFSLSTMDD